MNTTLRAPTLAELVVLIRNEPDPDRRRLLEDAYWSKSVTRHGFKKAAWYRAEYEWLKAQAEP